jgi:hypothetical protein
MKKRLMMTVAAVVLMLGHTLTTAVARAAAIVDRSGYWAVVSQRASVRQFPNGPEVKQGFRLNSGQYFHVDPKGGNSHWAMGFACPDGGRFCNSRENLQGFILRQSLGQRVSVNTAGGLEGGATISSVTAATSVDEQTAGARFMNAMLRADSAARSDASVQGEEATAASLPCDSRLWSHVYSRERLQVVRPCVSLTGTVVYVHPNSDGDIHILLNLEPHLRHAPFINNRNRTEHNGDLVVELICKATPHGDAIKACGNWRQPIPAPQLGERYVVTGALVQDNSPKHGWMELHPVSHIVRAPRRAALDAPSDGGTETASASYTPASFEEKTVTTGNTSLALDSERRICARDVWLRDDRLHPIGLLHQGDKFLVERYSDGSGNGYEVWALGRAYGPGVNPQGKRGRVMAKYLCR